MCDYLDVNNAENSDNESICSNNNLNKHLTNVDDSSETFSVSSNKHLINVDDNAETSVRSNKNLINVDDESIKSSICSNNEHDNDNEGQDQFEGISICSKQSDENIYFLYNNHIVPVSSNEIYPIESNNETIIMAALFNYSDDKDTSKFANIYLPEITISYNNLKKIFFTNYDNKFSPNIFNQFWRAIRGLSLSNVFLKTYESIYDLNADDLPAISKIKLYKECSFSHITLKAFKLVALNLEEFKHAFGSINRKNGTLYATTIFHFYSETLKVGIKITTRFAVKNVPNNHIKKENDDNNILFEF